MNELKELAAARRHLAKAESALSTEDGLFHLHEGLALLECVIEEDVAGREATLARNLGTTYTTRIYARVKQQIGRDLSTPEPELEHLFAVIRAFDDTSFDLPPAARELKVEVVKRLIDLYYEGHSPAEKQRVYEELAKVSRGGRE